jgi:signal transduction histidine kinase
MDGALRRTVWSRPLWVVAFFIAYLALGQLSYRTAFTPAGALAVWWAPSGLALAALVRSDRRSYPWLLVALFVAATAVNLSQGIRPIELPFRSLADCLEPAAGAWLLRRWFGPGVNLHTLREVAGFAVAGSVVGPSVGAVAAGLSGLLFKPSLVTTGAFTLLWWGSAVLGASLFAPILLTWRTPRRWPSGARALESALLALALLAVSLGSFFIPARSPLVLLIGFVAFPLLAWAAVRFGPTGATRAAACLSLFSLWPFLNAWRDPRPWQIFVTQGIYAVGGLTALTLSALTSEMRHLRQRADLQAREAEESLALLESALVGAPFGIAFFDPSLRLTRLNEVFAGLEGKSVAQLAGTPLASALPTLVDRLAPLLRATLLNGCVAELEFPISRADAKRWWRCSAFPVRARAGDILGAGLLLVDETERKATEQERGQLYRAAQEAVQVREDFLSIASHELKTPLTPIFARLGFLQRKLVAGEAISAESIDKPLQSLRKLTELINDLLDASRIQYGRLMLHPEPQALGELVRKSAEPFRSVSPIHQLVIDTPDEPLWAAVDTQRLTQVVTNLVDNAIKYSPEGGRIEVRLGPHPEGLELVVSDPGIGISAEQRVRLFERFYRAATAAATTGGLGLGLYITRDIVERHGGRIWVESEPGKGSRFHVLLPRLPEAELPWALH